MFGRTGAPTKRHPHKRTGKFLCEFSRAVKSIKLTVMSKKRSSVYGGKKTGADIAELDDDDD